MKRLTLLLTVLPLVAQTPVARPKILGVAHLAVFVGDLAKARAFYEDLLGYAEPFKLPKQDGSDQIAFVKINDHQYIELFNERNRGEGQLNHISIYTDNADRMREYLTQQDVKVPAQVGKGRIGNKNFTVKDPDGHEIEIVEYMKDGWSLKNAGKFMPASRISEHAMHVGVIVTNLEAATKFYTGILGMQEFWRGSAANSETLSWTNNRVPDGQDYIEFMLYAEPPASNNRGSAHHICLMVPDLDKALAAIEARPARKSYTRPLEIRTGINRKRQLNLFDPDGTRVELMEPNTVDGKPAPNSTLPPPK